jgi:predicted O-methyltransferase YrrM
MVRRFPSESHFVEIGTWKGMSAVYMGVEIFNSGKKIKFDCIDNWEFSDEEYTPEIYNQWTEPFKRKEFAFDEFLENIKPLSNIINYHKLSSIEASKLYADESLDFVFIDASHEYEKVKNDIIHWYPKIKYNGIIAGHDYCYFTDVKKAVDEFFIDKRVEAIDTSWLHVKLR